jgi:A/G-specific adenine glycosylase
MLPALDFMAAILCFRRMDVRATDPAATALLDWYDRHARPMPWRVPPDARLSGELPDPYHVWLSEVMLQQTQVRTVQAHFIAFISKWPTIKALCDAPVDDLMKAWAGLGYYSRARNLHKCARTVAFEMNGEFPRTARQLQALPGIGPYTGAAIAAIAFDEPVAVVDGNVERVASRLWRIEEPMPAGKETVRAKVQAMLPETRPGDFAQAMMDLGATLCTPKKPACPLCPLGTSCLARAAGVAEDYPRKGAKSKKPLRRGAAYVMKAADNCVFLQKRPEKGLLGGMAGVPTTGWTVRSDGGTGLAHAPAPGNWRRAGTVRHAFTHFELELEVWLLDPAPKKPSGGWWADCDNLADEALPTVMKKVIDAAIPDAFRRFGPGRQP